MATLFDDDYYTLTDNVSTRAYVGFNWKGLKFTFQYRRGQRQRLRDDQLQSLSGNAAGTGRLTKRAAA